MSSNPALLKKEIGFMLIGHRAQIGFLRRCFENKQLSHAYLFVGPEGVGKKKTARELADWVLGRESDEKESSADFQIRLVERIRDEKTGKMHKDISIKQIHEIRDFLNHRAFLSSFKVVIVDGAERMNLKAANALLKTLEEPGPQSIIILIAQDEKRLLPTIASRCQIIRFYPVAGAEIYQALIERGSGRDLALEISRSCFGLPGRALVLLSDKENLNFQRREKERFFRILKGDLSGRFSQAADLFSAREGDHIEKRDELEKILAIWSSLWRDMLVFKARAGELSAGVTEEGEIKKQVNNFETGEIREIIERIERASRFLSQNINPRLIFENLILLFYPAPFPKYPPTLRGDEGVRNKPLFAGSIPR